MHNFNSIHIQSSRGRGKLVIFDLSSPNILQHNRLEGFQGDLKGESEQLSAVESGWKQLKLVESSCGEMEYQKWVWNSKLRRHQCLLSSHSVLWEKNSWVCVFIWVYAFIFFLYFFPDRLVNKKYHKYCDIESQ